MRKAEKDLTILAVDGSRQSEDISGGEQERRWRNKRPGRGMGCAATARSEARLPGWWASFMKTCCAERDLKIHAVRCWRIIWAAKRRQNTRGGDGDGSLALGHTLKPRGSAGWSNWWPTSTTPRQARAATDRGNQLADDTNGLWRDARAMLMRRWQRRPLKICGGPWTSSHRRAHGGFAEARRHRD